MPREITDQNAVLDAIRNIDLIAELLEEKDGKQKYATDLEVIVRGRDYSNGKKVGPYVRLLVYEPGEAVMRQGEWGGNTFYLGVSGTLDVFVKDEESGEERKINQLGAGSCFGERSVLAGIQRNATIMAAEGNEATVLEITRPALRLLRKLPKFGHAIDETYRHHGLGRILEDMRQLTGATLSPELIEELGEAARFMVYGKNHVLCQEGAPVEKIILLKSGWARRVRGVAFDPETTSIVMGANAFVGVDFLGAGNCLGLEGVTADKTWNFSAAVMSRTEVLEINILNLRQYPVLLEKITKIFADFSNVDDDNPERITDAPDLRQLAATEEEIATGVVDGTNLLVMDMDLCVRCGNCSLACHKVHGQSRLLRRGIHIERPVKMQSRNTQHVLSPQVCMHCQDPECLTGCPTGAIFRAANGQVDIAPQLCIGCFDCATQCPYDAITMVPRGNGSGGGEPQPVFNLYGSLKNLLSVKAPSLPTPISEGEDMVAIKCNLCDHTPLNPAGAKTQAYSCEENCPTGALVRVNPHEYFGEVEKTLGLVFRDATHAVGRNIHESDPLSRLYQAGGLLITVALSIATLWAISRYGMNTPLVGSWLTMRWATGLFGLFGIALTMTYPARKQIYRRRAGALRYWMLAHIYLGTIAGVVLMLHGGKRTGGLLTTSLLVMFDLVIASGLFGLICYYLVPRMLTSIEGEPLLIEDLQARQTELRASLTAITDKCEDPLRRLIKEKVLRRFKSFGYLIRQYARRESLKTLLAEAREEIKMEADRLDNAGDKVGRALLMEAVEIAATLRRVDALVHLHGLLRIWIAPHVITTSLMLALMTVHLIQVVFFAVR
jgi:Fe-S-cluster-containing dehydrogenase component/CRP-like cAMP-binding protein